MMDGCLHDDPLALKASVEVHDNGPTAFSILRYSCGICDTPLGKHEPMVRDHLHREYAMASDQLPMQRIEDLPGYAPGTKWSLDKGFEVYDVLTEAAYEASQEVTPFSQVSTGRKWNREQGRFWPTWASAFNREDR